MAGDRPNVYVSGFGGPSYSRSGFRVAVFGLSDIYQVR